MFPCHLPCFCKPNILHHNLHLTAWHNNPKRFSLHACSWSSLFLLITNHGSTKVLLSRLHRRDPCNVRSTSSQWRPSRTPEVQHKGYRFRPGSSHRSPRTSGFAQACKCQTGRHLCLSGQPPQIANSRSRGNVYEVSRVARATSVQQRASRFRAGGS